MFGSVFACGCWALFTKANIKFRYRLFWYFVFFSRCFRRVESFQSLHKVRLFHVWLRLFICDVFLLLKFSSINNTPHKTVTVTSLICASPQMLSKYTPHLERGQTPIFLTPVGSEHSFPSSNGDTADVLRLFQIKIP